MLATQNLRSEKDPDHQTYKARERRNCEDSYEKKKEVDGWATPEESWLDKEASEDGETFFVNVKSMFLQFLARHC